MLVLKFAFSSSVETRDYRISHIVRQLSSCDSTTSDTKKNCFGDTTNNRYNHIYIQYLHILIGHSTSY